MKMREETRETHPDESLQRTAGLAGNAHAKLDAAVAAAYGFAVDLTDEQILEKLLALNQQRAAEEKSGPPRNDHEPHARRPKKNSCEFQTSVSLPEPDIAVTEIASDMKR